MFQQWHLIIPADLVAMEGKSQQVKVVVVQVGDYKFDLGGSSLYKVTFGQIQKQNKQPDI